jgi:3-hydroxyisobutyrate dehydrogenase
MTAQALSTDKTQIGFIGLGVMGSPMAMHILKSGYSLHVYNRTAKKTECLVKEGATQHDSLKSLAQSCDVIITMVGLPSDVKEVYFGDNGILNHAKENAIVIDMTTSSPKLATEINDIAIQKNIHAVDAPVSGGDTGAKNAALSIMVGCEKALFEVILPLFQCMGKNIELQGKVSMGQHTKMANQIVVAGNMLGVCESLAYAKKAGLNQKKVLDSISKGAAGSWALSNLTPRILENDYEPGFFVKHFIKDMIIALECATENDCELPGLKVALEQYQKLAKAGFENNGTQALYKLYH